jgi:hypothetical protein
MSDRPSHESVAAARKFLPDVRPLESRVLLSEIVRFPDGVSFRFPTVHNLPRTGGVSVQMGSVVGVGVGQPTTNTVYASDPGTGNFKVEWNGTPVHSFTGVTTTVILAERAKGDQITFNLIGSATDGAAKAVDSLVSLDAAPASKEGHPPKFLARRTSGAAVQSGSVLTVTVKRPSTNIVEISNFGAGAVQVEWNGPAVHSFTGVAMIVVDTHNARTDLVALHDVTD